VAGHFLANVFLDIDEAEAYNMCRRHGVHNEKGCINYFQRSVFPEELTDLQLVKNLLSTSWNAGVLYRFQNLLPLPKW
jgi:hypothetical protein